MESRDRYEAEDGLEIRDWLYRCCGSIRNRGRYISQWSHLPLRQGITRACVQCYAIEGRYPPSVAYLEERYGIQIDEERYNVFYSGFASNLMPDITVIPVEEP